MEEEKERNKEKEIEEKIEEKENEQEEKIEEVPQASEASLFSEGFDVSSATASASEAVTPTIKETEQKGQGLESSLQDVQTEKKEEEKKYVPFHYSSEQNRYATRAENIKSFETRQTEQVNAFREVVMPRTVEMPVADFIPRKEIPVTIIRENMPSQFREDVVKYKKVDKDNGLPESKWHDQKELKKYKVQTEF